MHFPPPLKRTIALRPPLRAVAMLAAAAVLVTGCSSSGDDWSRPHPKPTPVGTLGSGFIDPSTPPTPEGTVRPRPGSWTGVHPSKDYRVVLLTTGDDGPTKALVTAVKDWAEEEHVDLRTVVADAQDPIPSITKALEMTPDLIVSAGNDLVDPLSLVAAEPPVTAVPRGGRGARRAHPQRHGGRLVRRVVPWRRTRHVLDVQPRLVHRRALRGRHQGGRRGRAQRPDRNRGRAAAAPLARPAPGGARHPQAQISPRPD